MNKRLEGHKGDERAKKRPQMKPRKKRLSDHTQNVCVENHGINTQRTKNKINK